MMISSKWIRKSRQSKRANRAYSFGQFGTGDCQLESRHLAAPFFYRSNVFGIFAQVISLGADYVETDSQFYQPSQAHAQGDQEAGGTNGSWSVSAEVSNVVTDAGQNGNGAGTVGASVTMRNAGQWYDEPSNTNQAQASFFQGAASGTDGDGNIIPMTWTLAVPNANVTVHGAKANVQ